MAGTAVPIVSRRSALATLAAGGTIALAGCSAVSDAREAAGIGEVDPVWRHDLPATRAGHPTVAGGAGPVLVGAQDKAVHALALDDGRETFRYETGGPVQAPPVAPSHGDPYHVRSTDGDLYTLDRSGDLQWSREGIETEHLARVGSLVLTGDPASEGWFADRVLGVDARSGEVRFERSVAGDWRDGLRGGVILARVPVADADRIRIAGLSPADGRALWDTAPSEAAGLAADETLAVAVRERTVTGYDPATGRRRWRTPVRNLEYGPVRLGARVYVRTRTDEREGVAALDRSTGAVAWRRWVGDDVDLEGVVPGGDATYVLQRDYIDSEGGLLDGLVGNDDGPVARVTRIARDGTTDWTTDVPTMLIRDAVEVGAVIAVASDVAVAALDRSTGDLRWRYRPNQVGRLRIATGAGVLIAAGTKSGRVVRLPVR